MVSVWRSYVTRLFEVDTDFKNVFMLKNAKNTKNNGTSILGVRKKERKRNEEIRQLTKSERLWKSN